MLKLHQHNDRWRTNSVFEKHRETRTEEKRTGKHNNTPPYITWEDDMTPLINESC